MSVKFSLDLRIILGLMGSDFSGPVNIGSEEMVTINQMADTVMRIASKQLKKNISPVLSAFKRDVPIIG
jgi:hypothetical protein